MLEGLSSLPEADSTAAGRDQLRQFDCWESAVGPPHVVTWETAAPGPHGPVPVRVYEPAGDGAARPCLVWVHGGGFIGGDLDMGEADWTAREICARAGAIVVSVDYRLAVDGVHYPIPLNDCVAAVDWVRGNTALLGI